MRQGPIQTDEDGIFFERCFHIKKSMRDIHLRAAEMMEERRELLERAKAGDRIAARRLEIQFHIKNYFANGRQIIPIPEKKPSQDIPYPEERKAAHWEYLLRKEK